MTKLDPRIELPAGLALALFEAATVAARAAMTGVRRRQTGNRVRRGLTRRPGRDTPLWNELAAAAAALLLKRGEKAKLARMLVLPRQRLQDCLRAKSASLDAERTLLLLCWVAARQQGRELAIGPGGGGRTGNVT